MSTTSNGKIVVLTGATGGIGAAVGRALAERGFEIAAVVRDPGRVGSWARYTFQADLSVVAEVARVGRELMARLPHIDVLVNNAGLHAFSQRITGDGLPIMVAVNHVAPFVLSHVLLPMLRSADGRIVQVASDVHRRVRSLRLPQDLVCTSAFTGRESSRLYAESKLLGILFTKALARRMAGTGVTVNSCCPGLNVTGLGRESGFFSGLARVLDAIGLFSPERGARITVNLAASASLAGTGGRHFSHDGTVKPDTPLVADMDLQERLWAATLSLPPVAALGLSV